MNTPGGRSASAIAFASISAVSGVSDAGFSTTLHPITRAGAAFQTAIMNGKFHGMMPEHTPSGSRLTKFHDVYGKSTQGSGA